MKDREYIQQLFANYEEITSWRSHIVSFPQTPAELNMRHHHDVGIVGEAVFPAVKEELEMAGHNIIVVGASAGGVEALQTLMNGLPVDLPAALFVVVHIPSGSRSVLPTILTKAGPLPAAHAVDGEAIQQRCVYVARPDHHLVVERGYIRVTHGPKENRFRPAIDVLFRSAAYAYGPRTEHGVFRVEFAVCLLERCSDVLSRHDPRAP